LSFVPRGSFTKIIVDAEGPHKEKSRFLINRDGYHRERPYLRVKNLPVNELTGEV